MVDMHSGWNIGDENAHDIDAWFYLGPMTEHAELDSGHFTLWRGNDDLITEGANYLSRPTPYHLEWGALSFARNTADFTPLGSATPDLEGSELPPPTMLYGDNQMFGALGGERLIQNESPDTRERLARLSAETYPVANRVVWYPEYTGYLGRITDFRDLGAVAITTGDATAAYDPRHVESFQRSFIDVKPDLFIIRDHFRLHDVGRVRMLFHVRQRPQAPGLHVAMGTPEAGILEGEGNRVTIDRGESQAGDLGAVAGDGQDSTSRRSRLRELHRWRQCQHLSARSRVAVEAARLSPPARAHHRRLARRNRNYAGDREGRHGRRDQRRSAWRGAAHRAICPRRARRGGGSQPRRRLENYHPFI